MKLKTCFLGLFFSSVASAAPIENMVVFGDSLSDNGNLYEYMQHRVPQSPPYYKGRFSNGPVWIERLTKSVFPENPEIHLLDYAFGGAGVSMENDDDVLFSLNHELDVYSLAHDGKAKENSLYIMWIGANNYLALPEEDDETVIKDVMGGIESGLQRLASMGAKNILVLNLPDLGRTPMASEFDAKDRLTELTLQHNEQLRLKILDLKQRYPDVKWFEYDVYTAINDIFNNPQKYNLNNIEGTCYDVMAEKPSNKAILKMAAIKRLNDAGDLPDCTGYLFFDPVHVTESTHQVVADQVRALLERDGLVFSSPALR